MTVARLPVTRALAALLEMLQADFRVADLAWATELGDVLLERFHDRAGGGFFSTCRAECTAPAQTASAPHPEDR